MYVLNPLWTLNNNGCRRGNTMETEEKKVSRSRETPAPEEGSNPAMVRTFFIDHF